MKRLSRSVAILALSIILAVLSGCTGMVETELDETHAKLKALQELAASVNNDLTTLNEIVSRLDDNHTIDPSTLVQTDDGYEVSFRDGKTIHLHFGVDGVDGETLIPLGVRRQEDGLYYWTVDGEFLMNPDSTYMRAGATDGKDGIVPQTKVENGVWKLSIDGGKTFTEIATSDELDGVGVFSDYDISDPSKLVLILLDETVIEIPCQTSFKMSISAQDTVLIGGGETLPIPYEIVIEGKASLPVVVTSGTDGTYISRVEEGSGKGTVYVQAPEVFSEGYILLTANCGGYSTIKVISFKERQVSPDKGTIVVRLGKGDDTRTIEYDANFEYTVSQPDGEWLKAAAETGSITFTATPNTGETVRSCTVTVSPKDNPDYACTTFLVLQATDKLTFNLDPDCPFTFDSSTKTLDIPAEGGDADIWITYSDELVATGPEGAEWVSTEISAVDGFYRLRIHAEANESGESRKGTIKIKIKENGIPMGDIVINQK